MHGTAHRLAFFALIGLMVSMAYGINYMYFSDHEVTRFNDRIKFWHEDTLCGPIRSNDQIAVMQDPVFCEYVISSAADFWQGAGFNPILQFEPGVIHNAPPLPFPETATEIRQMAFDQGLYFNAGPDMQAWVRIREDTLRVTWAEMGQPFDSLEYEDILLPDTAVVFFDATLRISGELSTVLILGCSGRAGLEDNIYYAGTGYDPPVPPPEGHAERFALISENEIKVLNTAANGRENSNGQGMSQPDPDFTDIVLHGIYVALNESFTFEQQNDPDSGYVCTCLPDDRGTFWLWGSLMQARRGYVHRSTRNSTGYQKNYRYDDDLRFWDIHLWSDTLRENLVTPAQLNFGEVMVGDTAWDTVHVYNDFIPVWLSNIGSDFIVPVDSDSVNWGHAIPVGFAPEYPVPYTAELTFDIPYYDLTMSVPLSGTGLANAADDPFILSPLSFSLSSYPNPFNARTTLQFSLPTAGEVSLILYDVQGREAATLVHEALAPGRHSVSLDASALGTGIYFARLSTPTNQLTTKLLLIK